MSLNLHPGVAVAIRRLTADELGVARMIAAGELSSPQQYENIALFALRVTGTGAAYRRALEEFVWRDPKIYLNDEFLARCAGVPVVFWHQKGGVLSTKEFVDRTVGMIFFAYIKGDEVWAIARIYDENAAKIISSEQWSTSPTVIFRDPSVNSKVTLEDGKTLLIEGKPSLIDSLAICEKGVWDKGGPPIGVDSAHVASDSTVVKKDSDEKPSGVSSAAVGDTVMTEEENKAAEEKTKADAEKLEREDRARKDAESGEKLDKLLSHLDSLGKRMDAWDGEEKARKDAEEKERADRARRDAEEKMTEEERKVSADKAKKDAEEKERGEKERVDKAKKDAEDDKARKDADEIRKAVADMAARIPATMSDADYSALADAQARADSVYLAFGQSAPQPMRGETPLAYRVRLLNGVKIHSPGFKAVALDKVALADPNALDTIEPQIYADAETVARSPATVGDGELRRITKHVGAHIFHEYVGQPSAWMNPIAGATRQYVKKFNDDTRSAR
jgi:hypothetical protein